MELIFYSKGIALDKVMNVGTVYRDMMYQIIPCQLNVV